MNYNCSVTKATARRAHVVVGHREKNLFSSSTLCTTKQCPKENQLSRLLGLAFFRARKEGKNKSGS
jgi:hypothetical protein